jgi:adenosylcobinamide-GDP ribazoletransferase
MGKGRDRFLSTLSVVSRIPVKAQFNFDPSRMDYWLPVTGLFPALVGLLLFTAFSLWGKDPLVAAIVTLIAQYLCFNLFHLDGLMDSADAFLGTADREKRLAILKDSRVGVYGFFAGFAALSLKTAFLRVLFVTNRPALAAVFLAFPLFGRYSAALIPCMTKPANSGSLGAVAKDARPLRCVAGMITALACWALCAWGWLALTGTESSATVLRSSAILVYTVACTVLVSPLAAWFYARLYRNALGGYSGDALGAAIESAEILSLAVSIIICGV